MLIGWIGNSTPLPFLILIFDRRFHKLPQQLTWLFADLRLKKAAPSQHPSGGSQCHAAPFPKIKMISMFYYFTFFKLKPGLYYVVYFSIGFGEGILRFPICATGFSVCHYIIKIDFQVFGPAQQHSPHIFCFLFFEGAKGGIVKFYVWVITVYHGLGITILKCPIELSN